jgi:hypothetical protein
VASLLFGALQAVEDNETAMRAFPEDLAPTPTNVSRSPTLHPQTAPVS